MMGTFHLNFEYQCINRIIRFDKHSYRLINQLLVVSNARYAITKIESFYGSATLPPFELSHYHAFLRLIQTN